MLSEHTIAVIKSTVPVLEAHGTAITTRFYQLMFQNHPELLNVFNHANQKQGRQQAALANTVYAAAVYIDNLEAILPAVKQIGHKHRSLGIKAEDYAIIGKHLLLAIKDVLGDAATDEIIQAWSDAYSVIADAFISVEAEMYQQAEQQPGGWKGFRSFIVDRKVQESDVITSFYLVPEDGQPISAYEAGQYVSVKVNIPGEVNTHLRQYSLSDAPGKPYYRISVKREDAKKELPAGKVSTYLHEVIQPGDSLLLSAPAGDFTLDTASERPLVFISGGVGITPLMSMMKTAVEAQSQRPITFIHAALHGGVHAMKQQTDELSQQHEALTVYYCYEQPSEQDLAIPNYHKDGYIDQAWLESIIKEKDAEYYFCGPVPFMKAINHALQSMGIPADHIHYEFFGPKGTL